MELNRFDIYLSIWKEYGFKIESRYVEPTELGYGSLLEGGINCLKKYQHS